MKSYTTDDDLELQKELLEKDSELYKLALEQQLADMTHEAKKVGKTILLAGGGVLLTYLIAKKLFGKKKSKKKIRPHGEGHTIVKESAQPSFLSSMIKQQIALFLVDIAKEKISAHIAKNKNESVQ